MPEITIAIPEVRETMMRPIAFTCIRDMLKTTGIDENNVKMVGLGTQLPVVNSTIDKEDRPNRLEGDRVILVEVEEEYPEREVNSIAIRREEHKEIFIDEKLGIYIKPIYTQVELDITVAIETLDRIEASNWGKQMKKKTADGRAEVYHDLQYHYPIPNAAMVLLHGLYKMREGYLGYGDNFADYMLEHFDKRVGVITNLIGNGPTVVIKESSIGCLGMFEFGHDVPKKDKEDGGGTYRYEFNYKVIYDRPDLIYIRYPIQVHNQLVPLDYISTEKEIGRIGRHARASISNTALNKFAYNEQTTVPMFAGTGEPVPMYDDWIPKFTPPYHFPLVRWLLQIDKDSPKDLIGLTSLGDHELSKATLTYLTTTYKGILHPYKNALLLQLYQGDALLSGDRLTIDGNLDVRSKEELNPRFIYHLVLSVITDPTILSNKEKKEITKDCKFLKEYLRLTYPNSNIADLVVCNDKTTPKDNSTIWDKIPPRTNPKLPNPVAILPTVMSATIISRRK